MTVRQRINHILDQMSENQQKLVLELAEFLTTRAEAEAWRGFGLEQFARAYGSDEPEYTEADVRPGHEGR